MADKNKLYILKINLDNERYKYISEKYKKYFDWKQYLEVYKDLIIINQSDAWEHWVKYGIKENRFFFINVLHKQDKDKLHKEPQDILKKSHSSINFFPNIPINQTNTCENYECEQIELIKVNNLVCKKKYDNYGSHFYGWKGAINNFIKSYNLIENYYGKEIFFDEWIEKLLIWGNKQEKKIYINEIVKNKYKVISFIHNPPFVKWYNQIYNLQIQDSIIFNEEHTNKNLLLQLKRYNLFNKIEYLYTLTNTHKEYLYNKCLNLQNKLITVLHPIEITGYEKTFDFTLFCKNKQIFHIGWWLRNFKSFIDFKQPPEFNKTVLIKKSFESEWAILSRQYKLNNITILKELHNSDYEKIFVNSCMFLDLEDTNANNIILECMKFNTPVIVRKLPGIVEYLGEEYPLYFENNEQLNMLYNTKYFLNIIQKTNLYLSQMNKTHIHPDTFNKKIFYDIHKIENIYNPKPKYYLTWYCCIVNLDDFHKIIHSLYKNFTGQNNDTIFLKIIISNKLTSCENYKDCISIIHKYSNILDNIQYCNLDIDSYSDFLNTCFHICETNYFTVVNPLDTHDAKYSDIFINYLNQNPSCDIAFSSYGIVDKNYEEIIIFKKDLLVFDSNFSNILFPETGICWRKELYKITTEYSNLSDNNLVLREYFKNAIKNLLNIKCCHESPLYKIIKTLL